MKKTRKKLLASIAACILAGTMAFNGTLAYLTDTEGAVNIATVGKVNIDLEEPGYPGNDSDEVKSIIPNQEIVKDPQVENTGDNAAIVYLKVDVPQETFTELGADGTKGETKLQDLFALKGLSENWELIRTETSTDADTGKSKTTYVYAYRKTLGKGAKTDKLFEKVQMKNAIEDDLSGHVEDIVITACAIQATDIPDINLAAGENGNLSSDSLKAVYDIFLKQSGDKDVRPADEGNRAQNGKLGKITYALDGGTLPADALTEYGSDDFGYAPPKPVKKNYKFLGWSPTQLSSGSINTVTFTAQWEESSATLLSGAEIHTKIKALLAKGKFDMQAIQKSNEAPSASIMADANSLISTDQSSKPIYAWFANGAIKWWSPAEYVNAGSDLSGLFGNMKKLTDISGLAYWNTDNVTDMSKMFDYCIALTDLTPIANWNTTNVTNMGAMFRTCRNITDASAINNWDITNVTDFTNMFNACSSHPTFTKRAGTWNYGTFRPTT